MVSGCPIRRQTLPGADGSWASEKGYLRDQRDPGLRSLLNPMADRDSEEKKDGPVWFSVVWADVTQQSCLYRVSDPGRDAKHLSPSP